MTCLFVLKLKLGKQLHNDPVYRSSSTAGAVFSVMDKNVSYALALNKSEDYF
jgi:hypothetical protein